MAVTLLLETLAYLRVFTFPAGVTATALALVSSILVFIVVSIASGRSDPGPDPDIRAIIDINQRANR
jgi:hypothetical protein